MITIGVAAAEKVLDLSCSGDQSTVSGFLGTTASCLKREQTVLFESLNLGALEVVVVVVVLTILDLG